MQSAGTWPVSNPIAFPIATFAAERAVRSRLRHNWASAAIREKSFTAMVALAEVWWIENVLNLNWTDAPVKFL